MSIYQSIKDKFIMKNAWEDWALYRSQLTDLILEQNPKSVMIIGAGRCNDYDLRKISSATEKVVLSDVDEDAMKSAVMKLPDDLQKKVECRVISLTGITENDLEIFCERMLMLARTKGRELTLDYFGEQMLSCLEELQESLIQNETDLLKLLPENSEDLLVCCGVHSQLFSTLSFFLRSLISSLNAILPDVSSLESDADKKIRDMNDQTIPIINNVLRRAAGKTLIIGNEYNPGSPVEGAEQCISEVRRVMNPVEKHLLWQFNPSEGIVYDMLIQVCSIK